MEEPMRNLGALCGIAAMCLTISASGAPEAGSQGNDRAGAAALDVAALKPGPAQGSWIAFAPARHRPTAVGALVNPW